MKYLARRRHGRLVSLIMSALMTVAVGSIASAANWQSAGFDRENTRFNRSETTLGPGNVRQLELKWHLSTEGDVSATPAVEGDSVYVPDFSGALYAVNRHTGVVQWKGSIAAMTGVWGDFARATPAIAGDLLILGDQAGRGLIPSPDGWLLGINKYTGALVWKTKVQGGFPIITQAAVVKGDTAYIGIASNEELLARFGVPLTFRGSVLAL